MNTKKAVLFKALSLVSLVIAIVLEALPFSAALEVVTSPEETVTELYSYFNITVFSNGNYIPLIVAMLTILLTATALVSLVIKRKTPRISVILIVAAIVTTIISVCTIFYSLNAFTITGIIITLLIIASAMFSALSIYANIE